jgi:hypothetical protein
MDKKQVLIRVSQETYDRLQGLSDKYGMSASALVVSLVNDRWLSENMVRGKSQTSEQKTDLRNLALEMGAPVELEVTEPVLKQSRKRHRPKH